MIFNPNEHTVVFLSYDEPNCDENFQHLLTLRPDALRVHGVKGSDTAHKKVAEISLTKNVIIVDGDNIVNRDFFHTTIELNDDVDLSTSVLSFSGLNCINGTKYGNGGIKVWPTELIKNMQTHENSQNLETKVDFHLENYLQLNHAGSTAMISSSPKQAWRAGFRDGVKLCLNDKGVICELDEIDWRNFDRLWNWMHIGQDVENGLWAIYGARLGVYMTVIKRFDYTEIEDFDYLDRIFNNAISSVNLIEKCNNLGKAINHIKIKDMLSVEHSKRYKETVSPVYRSPELFLKEPHSKEYDIVFISYHEPNSDYNYKKLCERFPRAKRVVGAVGSHQTYIQAAKLCSTDYFWVVDANAEIVDDFNFDYVVSFYDILKVRIWRAKNVVTDMVSGYGGVKLLPRTPTIRMDNIKIEHVMVVSNITRSGSQ